MPHNFILFDMDGVLLEPNGYHNALRASVRRIGSTLGVPNAQITEDQIARFETASITNEWDTVAICAALILVFIWQINPAIRLNNALSQHSPVSHEVPDFDHFLSLLTDGGSLPGMTAYNIICNLFYWLTVVQKSHLKIILENCRDVYSSLTLPAHQETVLGSKVFQDFYGLEPKLDIEGYLLMFDRPLMTAQQHAALIDWLNNTSHFAGIMTNRPNRTPEEYLSAPEAELGVKLIGLESLPCIGSGTLGWFTEKYMGLPHHTLAKPNPVHALALLQRCLGRSQLDALQSAAALWQGKGDYSDWEELDGGTIIIFEDSVKGFISGHNSKNLLQGLGLNISMKLVGVSKNAIKLKALEQMSTFNIDNINRINWRDIFL